MMAILIRFKLALGICIAFLFANAIAADQKQLVIYGVTGKVGSYVML